ncbi:hypothetical protein BJ912DRAFT_1072390 [Pholiota molesta]|nr:hypothetical protein BJ912DRAFT_1072390 [Pholiota molesta]
MSLSASAGSGNSDAQFPAMRPDTNARAAAPRDMELALVLAQRKSEPSRLILSVVGMDDGGMPWWMLDRYPSVVLNYARLKRCIGDGTIDPPDITAEEIQDRAKGDFISKGLVILQTSWFILQCLARWSQKLALSELEVVTLGLALLNGITYAL